MTFSDTGSILLNDVMKGAGLELSQVPGQAGNVPGPLALGAPGRGEDVDVEGAADCLHRSGVRKRSTGSCSAQSLCTTSTSDAQGLSDASEEQSEDLAQGLSQLLELKLGSAHRARHFLEDLPQELGALWQGGDPASSGLRELKEDLELVKAAQLELISQVAALGVQSGGAAAQAGGSGPGASPSSSPVRELRADLEVLRAAQQQLRSQVAASQAQARASIVLAQAAHAAATTFGGELAAVLRTLSDVQGKIMPADAASAQLLRLRAGHAEGIWSGTHGAPERPHEVSVSSDEGAPAALGPEDAQTDHQKRIVANANYTVELSLGRLAKIAESCEHALRSPQQLPAKPVDSTPQEPLQQQQRADASDGPGASAKEQLEGGALSSGLELRSQWAAELGAESRCQSVLDKLGKFTASRALELTEAVPTRVPLPQAVSSASGSGLSRKLDTARVPSQRMLAMQLEEVRCLRQEADKFQALYTSPSLAAGRGRTKGTLQACDVRDPEEALRVSLGLLREKLSRMPSPADGARCPDLAPEAVPERGAEGLLAVIAMGRSLGTIRSD